MYFKTYISKFSLIDKTNSHPHSLLFSWHILFSLDNEGPQRSTQIRLQFETLSRIDIDSFDNSGAIETNRHQKNELQKQLGILSIIFNERITKANKS